MLEEVGGAIIFICLVTATSINPDTNGGGVAMPTLKTNRAHLNISSSISWIFVPTCKVSNDTVFSIAEQSKIGPISHTCEATLRPLPSVPTSVLGALRRNGGYAAGSTLSDLWGAKKAFCAASTAVDRERLPSLREDQDRQD